METKLFKKPSSKVKIDDIFSLIPFFESLEFSLIFYNLSTLFYLLSKLQTLNFPLKTLLSKFFSSLPLHPTLTLSPSPPKLWSCYSQSFISSTLFTHFTILTSIMLAINIAATFATLTTLSVSPPLLHLHVFRTTTTIKIKILLESSKICFFVIKFFWINVLFI